MSYSGSWQFNLLWIDFETEFYRSYLKHFFMLFNRKYILQAVIAFPSCRFRSSRPYSQCNGLAGYSTFKVQSGIKIIPSLLVVKKWPSDNQKNQSFFNRIIFSFFSCELLAEICHKTSPYHVHLSHRNRRF